MSPEKTSDPSPGPAGDETPSDPAPARTGRRTKVGCAVAAVVVLAVLAAMGLRLQQISTGAEEFLAGHWRAVGTDVDEEDLLFKSDGRYTRNKKMGSGLGAQELVEMGGYSLGSPDSLLENPPLKLKVRFRTAEGSNPVVYTRSFRREGPDRMVEVEDDGTDGPTFRREPV